MGVDGHRPPLQAAFRPRPLIRRRRKRIDECRLLILEVKRKYARFMGIDALACGLNIERPTRNVEH